MAKVKLKVDFETITPLWTGDAWMKNSGIRLSSLIGSLRFWFEVICYFGGICKKEEFDSGKGRFEKDIKNDEIRKKLLDFGTDFNGQVKALRKINVPVPAIVFGTTGGKGLIEIKNIQPLEDYCFGNKLNLPDKFCINKNSNQIQEGKDCPRSSNNNYSVFYFKIPYFWGKFEVVFEVEQNIKDTIFLPLLTFMDKYGDWGGGWNIGYGRLRVINVNGNNIDWRKEEFDFGKFLNENKNKKLKIDCSNGNQENCIVQISNNKDDLTNIESKKIVLSKEIKQNLKEIIKSLIKEKSELRRSIQDDKKRHKIFGSIKEPPADLPQGSKILPYINRLDDGSYQCGLLSIAGILSLYD